jgi:hypothetical protein
MVKQFVVMQECSNGNERVGDMWIETHVFPPTATLEEIWKWARGGVNHGGGRTMIRPDAGSIVEDERF